MDIDQRFPSPVFFLKGKKKLCDTQTKRNVSDVHITGPREFYKFCLRDNESQSSGNCIGIDCEVFYKANINIA